MKKFLQRVLGMVVAIIGFGYNFCYADEIDPMFPYIPYPYSYILQELATVNVGPMIIIGVIIAVIVVAAIIILAKSKKEKDKEKNDEK